jgi:molybdenum cofactor synthesis domain-containing protein
MSQASKPVTACLIIIGNEILSGRTVDANLPHIAKVLGQVGIRLAEARVVADDEAAIVDAVNTCRARHTYVFTTGGIGPTHDDITAACIAKAFGRPFGRNAEAERRLLAFYPPERVNEARMSMADMPEGVELIDNPVSVAPGFRIENVFVLAGVPKIMQAMLDLVLPKLEGGVKVHARAATIYATSRSGSPRSRRIFRASRSAAIPSSGHRGRARRSWCAAPMRRRSTRRSRPCTPSPKASAPRSRTSTPADRLPLQFSPPRPRSAIDSQRAAPTSWET